MSSHVWPILAHRWPPLPAGYLPTRFASDARSDLMRARHHKFASCYNRKACLRRIILVSVRSMQNKLQNSFCVVLIGFSQNMRESATGGLYYKGTYGIYDGIIPET